MFNFFKKKKEIPEYSKNSFPHFVGFFTAHAIWMLEGGETVVPIIATKKNGKRNMERILHQPYENAVETGKQRIIQKQKENDCVLFAYDGFLTLKDKKYEAIFIEALENKAGQLSKISFAIPYRGAKSEEGLAIYRPKVIKENLENFNEFFTEFYKGAENHEKAITFWNKYLDQSQ